MRPRNVLAIAFALGLSMVQPALALNAPDEEAEIEQAEARETYAAAPVADPHDPNRAMHPVRIAAYALHPVGVALDWVLVRPAVWVARQEPFRTLFGYED